MIRPLIVNRPCYFAHSPGGECLRAFLNAMNKEEWEPIVYASDKTPLVEMLPEYAKLTHEKRYVQYLAAAIRRFLLPDLTWLPGYEWWSWGIGAKKAILKDVINGRRYDYIHSVSFPCACHTVAKEVKKTTGLPWIMQLYDPWADNPYRNFKTQFLKRYDWKQERECVEQADLIIHDNEAIADLWRERYGEIVAKKIVVLPLTVPLPKVKVEENHHKNGDTLTISHIGNFMLNRTSQPFIKAVARTLDKHPECRERLRVNYVGQVTEQEKDLINKCDLTRVFNLAGSISSEACIDYYKNSDVFLAVDGVNKDNLFFPSKILKYLYFQRPILGITPMGSVLDNELQKAGHISIENCNEEEIVAFLERALFDYSSLLSFNVDYWKRFEPLSVVNEYSNIVDRIL